MEQSLKALPANARARNHGIRSFRRIGLSRKANVKLRQRLINESSVQHGEDVRIRFGITIVLEPSLA